MTECYSMTLYYGRSQTTVNSSYRLKIVQWKYMNNKEGGDKNMTVVVGSNWFSWHVLYPKTTTTQTRQHSRNDITHNHMKNKGGLSQAVDQHCTKKNNRQHISSRFQCVYVEGHACCDGEERLQNTCIIDGTFAQRVTSLGIQRYLAGGCPGGREKVLK